MHVASLNGDEDFFLINVISFKNNQLLKVRLKGSAADNFILKKIIECGWVSEFFRRVRYESDIELSVFVMEMKAKPTSLS